MPFDDFTTTGAHHPATSRAAAEKALLKAGTQRRHIYDYIRHYGPDGATDDEIAADLKILPNSVRPRRSELAQAGLIVRAGHTRRNVYGNACDVWVVAD